jgi:competence protein ComEA
MLKKILLIAATIFAFGGAAFAATDLNSADKAALDSIKTIGPKTADAIIAERTKAGKFKDWDDFIRRVKGVGPKNAEKMSAGGLTINGAALANAPASTETTKKTSKASRQEDRHDGAGPDGETRRQDQR